MDVLLNTRMPDRIVLKKNRNSFDRVRADREK